MRSLLTASLLTLALAAPGFAQSAAPTPSTAPAPSVGQAAKDAATATGQAVSNAGAAVSAKLDDLRDGWNLKRGVIDQSVYDEKNARIGEIDDLILTGDASKGYHLTAIVGVGGFLGIGERKVATPLESLKKIDGKFVMPGVTKEGLASWPEYRFAAPVSTTTTTTTTTSTVPGTSVVPPAPATTTTAPSSVPAPSTQPTTAPKP